ncbi:MAG: SLC13 family permease [Desulfobacterales bacterium]|nr:SLC13 family permease [Desulfobacterales bacterium]MDD3081530.1 SLC13 family permease [Desulfobacterales bacterium]MDD3950044.1 SLC13 family permease [Desulfobacterales bacterium]
MYHMRSMKIIILISALLMLAPLAWASHGGKGANSGETILDGDRVSISGSIVDTHSEPIAEAELRLTVDGKVVDEFETGHDGKYLSRFTLEKGAVSAAKILLEARKASFKAQESQIEGAQLARAGNQLYFTQDITLSRTLGPAFWISTLVFILAYALITFELLHRTIAAMLGAGLMMVISYTIGVLNPEYHIFSFERAILSIDMNVIFLLMGMMIIVGILKHTGVFQWCAYMSYKLAKGKVFLLSVYLMIFTGVASAFLDNVTTMLLLTGVAIEICTSLSINPLSMLIPLVLASNIGGTATLIGDPPNIMIGSYAGLTFMDFVIALGMICVLCMIALAIYTRAVWGKEYAKAKVENVPAYIEELKAKYRIKDSTLLKQGIAVLIVVVFLFLSHGYWHMEVSIAALTGASALLTIAVLGRKVDLLELIEKDIEWPTLMFFIFLFILVGAVESSGLLALIADWIQKLAAGNFVVACALILWVAAIVSAFVDNIPFTATMLPIVAYLSQVIPGAENTLWWALALGACFGGNGTIIGASANVVTMGIAESRGYKISFGGFLKVAFPYMIISVIIAHIWLMIVRPS